MSKNLKFAATALLLMSTSILVACGKSEVEATENQLVADESQKIASASSEGILEGQSVVIAQAQGSVPLYIRTSNNRFVQTDINIPRSGGIYVTGEERHNRTSLYKKVRLNQPVDELWIRAVDVDCYREGEVNRTCNFR